MVGSRAQSMLLRALTTWMFNSRPVNDGSISHRRIMRWPGSLSLRELCARQNPSPQANWRYSRNRTAPSSFRRTARRGLFSVRRPSIRMIWCLGTTRCTRLKPLSWRENRRFNASATNSRRLDCSGDADLLNHFQGLMKNHFAPLLLILGVASASAAPTTYTVDPDHTHPSFEVDHFGGLSTWRGTFKKTSGTVAIDTEAKTGTVNVIIDAATIDFAHDKLNEHVSGPEMLDVAKYPSAEYKGKFVEFANGAPTSISGDLTLHGITKPVTLTINSFK